VVHDGERKTYRGSRTALSLVAFYADRRHEVLPVASGYRIALTYNLLLRGDTSRGDGDDAIMRDVTDLLHEHFSAPAPRYYGGPAGNPPNRLAYLLDRLRTRLARPRRASGDWSVTPPAGCACDLCDTLRCFLENPDRRALEWPLALRGRQHIHSRIDVAELPVTHVTRRQGRPYTLVLTKTSELFTREQQAHARDQTDLQWLTDQRNTDA
jgi:hypothetical protein